MIARIILKLTLTLICFGLTMPSLFAQRTIEFYEPDFDTSYCAYLTQNNYLSANGIFLPHINQFYSKTAKHYKIKMIAKSLVNDSILYIEKTYFDKKGFLIKNELHDKSKSLGAHWYEQNIIYSRDHKKITVFENRSELEVTRKTIYFLNKNNRIDSIYNSVIKIYVYRKERDSFITTAKFYMKYDLNNFVRQIITDDTSNKKIITMKFEISQTNDISKITSQTDKMGDNDPVGLFLNKGIKNCYYARYSSTDRSIINEQYFAKNDSFIFSYSTSAQGIYHFLTCSYYKIIGNKPYYLSVVNYDYYEPRGHSNPMMAPFLGYQIDSINGNKIYSFGNSYSGKFNIVNKYNGLPKLIKTDEETYKYSYKFRRLFH